MKTYTIKEVMEIYAIKSRQTFYNWINLLQITPNKNLDGKNIITESQLKLIDELNEHIKLGGSLKSFIPTRYPEILAQALCEIDNPESVYNSSDTTLDNVNSIIEPMGTGDNSFELIGKEESTIEPRQLELFGDMVTMIGKEIAEQITEKMVTPINHWHELHIACERGYILSSKEIKQLVGTKPKGNEWVRGCYKFTKVGKIGMESGWKLTKL